MAVLKDLREIIKSGRVLGEFAAGKISKEEAGWRIEEAQREDRDPAASATTKPTTEFPHPPQTAIPDTGGAKAPKPGRLRRRQRAPSRTRGRGR
jgi:hypothetical protein